MKLAGWKILLFGFPLAHGHLIMTSPEPYSKQSLNNSPLAADGSDFPCKLRENGFRTPSQETIYHIGDKQTIRLLGSAIHGGGSCQISLTTDLEPTKISKWSVIKSFEGGCPSDASWNLGGLATTDHDLQIPFKIPEGISPGRYTLAWTWFNKIGNREMYMNCAPITVAKPPLEQYSKNPMDVSFFPPMFVANINGCMTKEGVDIRFPEPGDIVDAKGQGGEMADGGGPACVGNPRFGFSADSAVATTLNTGGDIPIISSAPASSIPASNIPASNMLSSGILASKHCSCSCHGSHHAMATTIPKQGLRRE
ncbi:uncharacterized protein N7469_001976 [Penicillium citrinum]|uniref:Lytic polysaccharide monooxygenase n=1 Tax=Penicillium citrinum TaxID=5077 RepID=A0A9W9TT31_PENCI|nr:uncharacterized protein N7469_001976 [Penicillium citrinum]KAJ5240385.1 hypothetical protein N7469_001976 [Penicillium citrinum]